MPVSSSTRGVYASGSPSTNVDFITIASQGNGTDYADLSVARSAGGGADNSVKGVFAGSYPNSNTIDSLIIATGGTATDFGDMTAAREKAKGVSNSHGGLNDGYQGTRPLPIGGTGRGIVLGGYNSPAAKSTIEFFNIASTGNAADFGDASLAASFGSANSSSTRMIMQGGYTDALTTETDTIQYVEMQSQGNGADFGNLLSSRANSASTGSCSTTRGLSEAGGTGGGGVVNEIEYITMASVGNGTDFGDLTVAREVPAACSSPTRGVCGGGDTPSASNVMDYVTIASTGNSTDFGDLTVARSRNGACSSSTRGVFAGGDPTSNVIDYITIASTGNATDFGDLLNGQTGPNGMSNNVRGVFCAGRISPANINVLQFITIASTGDAQDFGDLLEVKEGAMTGSDSHGGLQG